MLLGFHKFRATLVQSYYDSCCYQYPGTEPG